jgi:hypothetical protein
VFCADTLKNVLVFLTVKAAERIPTERTHRFARIKSAFKMNNIQRADVTLLHGLWMTKLHFARHRVLPTPPSTLPSHMKWQMPNYFDVDARGIALSQYFCPTEKLGTCSFYFGTFYDNSGNPLQGENNYLLHVPAAVPVREFWSFTVYSLETSSFFLKSPRVTLSSLDKELRKNADGSVDIYIGPKPPAGKESNWVYTQSGQKWFPWFRLYGPEKAVFDKSWKLPDIEKVN